jgi:preprotein translocase subunit SecE
VWAIDKAKETRTFTEECVVELQKVTWPDAGQLKGATIVVLVFTMVVSLIIWLMDKSASFVINAIMGIFGA